MAELDEIKELRRLWEADPSSGDFRRLYRLSKWGGCFEETVIKGIRGEQTDAIEDGIHYLEADPWYFRSGYQKAAIARALKAARLSPSQEERLRSVILSSLDGRIGREEFREYARLAIRITNSALLRKLEEQAALPRTWAQLRAKFILELCRRHGKGADGGGQSGR
ncbi:MAG: hypothetical protein JXB62_18265 [Pirellulales bacterium]|nr:hypothetical protein [Pirellulales bacterium]